MLVSISKQASFISIKVDRELWFQEATFKEVGNFNDSNFNRQSDFSYVNFKKGYFNRVIFKDKTRFEGTVFIDDIFFSKCSFVNAYFISTELKSEFVFFDCIIQNELYVYRPNLTECNNFLIWNCFRIGDISINVSSFIALRKLKDFFDSRIKNVHPDLELLSFFKVIRYKDPSEHNYIIPKPLKIKVDELNESDIELLLPKLDDEKIWMKDVRYNFDDVLFSNKCFFENLDLTRTNFNGSLIKNLNFINCFFGNESRVVLNEEKVKINEQGVLSLEESYRQLKINFESSKNWELSGKAYRSEMEMRMKRYKINSNLNSISGLISKIHYWIFWLYKNLSGYTQSYLKPLSIILVSTFFVFPFLYYLIGCYELQENHGSLFFSNILFKSLKPCFCNSFFEISFSNTIFFLKSDAESYWWLMSSQKVFSSVMLTFFILGLRKRFKQ